MGYDNTRRAEVDILFGMAFALAVLFGNLHRIIIAAAWAYGKIKDANRKG